MNIYLKSDIKLHDSGALYIFGIKYKIDEKTKIDAAIETITADKNPSFYHDVSKNDGLDHGFVKLHYLSSIQ